MLNRTIYPVDHKTGYPRMADIELHDLRGSVRADCFRCAIAQRLIEHGFPMAEVGNHELAFDRFNFEIQPALGLWIEEHDVAPEPSEPITIEFDSRLWKADILT